MSLDDFVISYFVYGPSFVTLPVEIYNYTKKPLHPKIYALFTVLFAAILLIMVTHEYLRGLRCQEDTKYQKNRKFRKRCKI